MRGTIAAGCSWIALVITAGAGATCAIAATAPKFAGIDSSSGVVTRRADLDQLCCPGTVFRFKTGSAGVSLFEHGMDADERDICLYLKSWQGKFVSGKEIARRAGGKSRFRQDPNWAVPLLLRLVEKGILESDATGHFRLRPLEKKKEKNKKFISPELKKILEQSGKDFGGGVLEIEDEEDMGPV